MGGVWVKEVFFDPMVQDQVLEEAKVWVWQVYTEYFTECFTVCR